MEAIAAAPAIAAPKGGHKFSPVSNPSAAANQRDVPFPPGLGKQQCDDYRGGEALADVSVGNAARHTQCKYSLADASSIIDQSGGNSRNSW